MATARTECTELSIGFGLLQVDPSKLLVPYEVHTCFSGSLSNAKYNDFRTEFLRNEEYYRRFYAVGLTLRGQYIHFRTSAIKQVRWEGPNRQAAAVSLPIDLVVLNTPISIKDDSDVVHNRSPVNLFERLPQGQSLVRRSPNWYLGTAPRHYQDLYLFARNTWDPTLPILVTDYHRQTDGQSRREFGDRISAAEGTLEFEEYRRLYVEMCRVVSEETVRRFNTYYQASQSGPEGNAVNEGMIETLFRIGDVKYLLCGLDNRRSYAVEIPDLSTWKRNWRLKRLQALPDSQVERGQPVVKLAITIEEKASRIQHELRFRVEIRWSHGRFGGNPEAKVYKEFAWTDVPFVSKIIGREKYQKLRIIGEGGFGIVYEAMDISSKRRVAVKELTTKSQDMHESERFAREVRLQSQLSHPNVMPVLDTDLGAPTPWFVMPLAAKNLGDLVEASGGIEDPDLLRKIFEQILLGVRYSHERQILHRDLKPENILIFEPELVKVTDFGLGKQIDAESPDWGLTSTGESLGTLQYAAPEQIRSSADVDTRADIYSLGKILYFCLTGDAPYPSLNLDTVEPRYRSIINRCVAEDPAARYQTVADLLSAFNGT